MVELPYDRAILRLAAESGQTGRLDGARFSAARDSLTCGAHVTVDLALDPQGRIVGYGHRVQACAIGQAAAALLAHQAPGRSLAELRAGRQAVAARLAGSDAPLPEGWDAWVALDSVRPIRQRHEAALLALDAAIAALVEPETAEGGRT
jgi:NifU-like protein involved in Fe-S cluster formation